MLIDIRHVSCVCDGVQQQEHQRKLQQIAEQKRQAAEAAAKRAAAAAKAGDASGAPSAELLKKQEEYMEHLRKMIAMQEALLKKKGVRLSSSTYCIMQGRTYKVGWVQCKLVTYR